MKRIVINIFFVFCFVSIIFGQAKKPTLMVMPSDQWCVARGYVVNFDNQGLQETVSDYNAAVKDVELMNVISKINMHLNQTKYLYSSFGTFENILEQITKKHFK